MLSAFLYLSAILSAFFAGRIFLRHTSKRLPLITILVCAVLLFCLVWQIISPDILLKFERNSLLINKGEWWRIFTALFFQDGFIYGGISNIVFLLMIGTIAEQNLTRISWIILYFLTGVLTELIAMYWQPVGAGNSISFFGLASSIVLYIILQKRKNLAMLFSIVSILFAAILLIRSDIHGAAFFIGLIISAFLIWIQKKNSKMNLPFKRVEIK